jgi:hypothetical protein
MRPLARSPFLVAAILVYGAGLSVPLLFLALPPAHWPLAGYAAFAAVSLAWQRIHSARLMDAGLSTWPSFPLAAMLFALGCVASELAAMLYAITPSNDGTAPVLPASPVLEMVGGVLERFAPARHGDAIVGTLAAACIALPLAATIVLALVPSAHRERTA